MAALRPERNGIVMHWCYGCKTPHPIWVNTECGPRWSFNGDIELPTFSPAISHRRFNEVTDKEFICSYTILDGKITYLKECTHSMAGKTLELPDFDTI